MTEEQVEQLIAVLKDIRVLLIPIAIAVAMILGVLIGRAP